VGLSADTATEYGDVRQVSGVTETARLGAELPSVVRVTTVTEYAVPSVSPVMVQLVVVVEQLAPPGCAVAA